jgi:hypothetical protein
MIRFFLGKKNPGTSILFSCELIDVIENLDGEIHNEIIHINILC